MKALCWRAPNVVQVERVPDPQIINPHDAIVRITSTAICGSDLHIHNGFIPMMKPGDILGHEFMGEIVEVGKDVQHRKVGDRVAIPFFIACGQCYYCQKGLWSACDNTNPNADVCTSLYGASGAGIFGYSHIYGGYSGGQAEFARVPFIDVNSIEIPSDLDDDQVLFLTDIFPTGYMAAENCNIQPGDTVAVWGCGPVGQFAIQSACMLGAERVIAIDRFPERLEMARLYGRAIVINYEQESVGERLRELTGGHGPDSCIDAVGMEAHGQTVDAVVDTVKQKTRLGTDRPHALREAVQACRKGGTVSVPGVYGGFLDKFNFGAAFAKGLTFKMGQTHVHRYMPMLLKMVQEGRIDPSFVITHRMKLDDAAHGYKIFKHKEDECIKIVLKP